jgi:hypothetical protein
VNATDRDPRTFPDGTRPEPLPPGAPIPPHAGWPREKPEGYAGSWPPGPNPFLDAALAYAARGWRVHPLVPRDKKPRLKDWPTLATTDAEQIRAWWREEPDANVGLVPGPKSAGLAVVDVDPRNGGLVTWEALRRRLPVVAGSVPALRTPLVRTGGGGYHLYYDASALLAAGTRLPTALGPGVDLHANDRLNIVAPPSIHPVTGQAYAFTDTLGDLAPYPEGWLTAAAASAPTPLAGERGEIAAARRALAALDPTRADTYEGAGHWLEVGLALKSVSDDLLEDWDTWSRQSAKYAPGICAEKWATFKPRADGLTLASLLSWAYEDEERGGLIFADTVPVEPIAWLWYGRIAFGKPQGLVGLPDMGKDVIACDVAARLSRGGAFGDKRPAPAGPRPTYYLSVEDALADTIKPRFLAAGGDERYLVSRRVVRHGGTEAMLTLDEHLDTVRRDLANIRLRLACGPGLIVLSPLDAFFSSQVNAWKAADIRRVMAPIATLLEETGWALWAIIHLNKDPKQAPIHRIANSQAVGAALRLAYLVGEDPADPARRVFVPLKRNLVPPDVSGLALQHVSEPTPGIANPGPQDTVPRARWLSEFRLTAADVLAGPTPLSSTEAAAAWLAERLAGHTDLATGVDGKTLEREAEAAGHHWSTVKKAAATTGARSERVKDSGTGKLGGSVWWLEEDF